MQRFDLAARTIDGRTTITQADIDVPKRDAPRLGVVRPRGNEPARSHAHRHGSRRRRLPRADAPPPVRPRGRPHDERPRHGNVREPEIAGGFDIIDPRVARFSAQRAFGALALDGPNVKLLDAEIRLSHGTLDLSGEIPLLLDPTIHLGPSTAALSFLVESRDVDIADLAPLLGNSTRLAGTLNGRFGVDGTVGTPRLVGNLALAKGSYVSNLERQPLTNISAQLAFTGANVRVQALHADAGKGTIDGNGTALLPIIPGSALTYALGVTIKAAQIDLPQYVSGTVDGAVRLVRSGDYPIARGALALTNATIPVSAIYNRARRRPTRMPRHRSTRARPHALGGQERPRPQRLHRRRRHGRSRRRRDARRPATRRRVHGDERHVQHPHHASASNPPHVNFTPDAGLVPNVDLRALARVSTARDSFDVTTIVHGTTNNLATSFETDRNYSKDEILAYLSGASALGFTRANRRSSPEPYAGSPRSRTRSRRRS